MMCRIRIADCGSPNQEWRNNSSELGVRSSEREVKCSALSVRRSDFRKIYKNLLPLLPTFLLVVFILQSLAFGADKWAGVDESVVNKVAQEQGRKAWKPLINTDQGDLLLFVFLLAGAVGGFIAGYYWRVLMVERSSLHSKEKSKS